MATTKGDPFATEICEILKLDSTNLQSLNIQVEPNSAVLVTAILYLQKEQGKRVRTAMKHYKVVEL